MTRPRRYNMPSPFGHGSVSKVARRVHPIDAVCSRPADTETDPAIGFKYAFERFAAGRFESNRRRVGGHRLSSVTVIGRPSRVRRDSITGRAVSLTLTCTVRTRVRYEKRTGARENGITCVYYAGSSLVGTFGQQAAALLGKRAPFYRRTKMVNGKRHRRVDRGVTVNKARARHVQPSGSPHSDGGRFSRLCL